MFKLIVISKYLFCMTLLGFVIYFISERISRTNFVKNVYEILDRL